MTWNIWEVPPEAQLFISCMPETTRTIIPENNEPPVPGLYCRTCDGLHRGLLFVLTLTRIHESASALAGLRSLIVIEMQRREPIVRL
jgi:hypothetical protein